MPKIDKYMDIPSYLAWFGLLHFQALNPNNPALFIKGTCFDALLADKEVRRTS